MNPLFNLLGGGNANPFQGTPFGNVMNFINYANQVKQSIQGNYEQQAHNMVQNGQLSQDQLNGYVQQAQGIQQFMQQFFGRR